MNTPDVSVVVPFLDPSPGFFHEAIESVRQQTLTNWELLLVDDGSGRAARDVAAESAERDGRIKVVSSPGPQPAGIGVARNVGIAASHGEFVAMLDADDVYEPTRLERHVAALRTEPSAAMACGHTLYWQSWRDRATAPDTIPAAGVPVGLVAPPRLLVAILHGRGAVPCVCSLTVRRRVLDEVGGFEPAFRSLYEDQVLLAKILGAYPVLYIAEALDRYRIHPGSLTAGTTNNGGLGERWHFLDWLKTDGMHHVSPDARDEVERALNRAGWQLRHPHLTTVQRRFRKSLRRLRGR